jgi:hypothetical protein
MRLLKLFVIMVFLGSTAHATDESDLVGLGLPGAVATKIATGMEDGVFSDDLTVTDNATISGTLAVTETSTLTGNVTVGGTLIGTGTATLGWTVQAGANTACTTTCTTPCVFGVNTAATEADIVDCADATADECLCAGAS